MIFAVWVQKAVQGMLPDERQILTAQIGTNTFRE